MCEYSLECIAFRPDKVGDKLVMVKLPNTVTYGFALLDDPTIAVCLAAGTELAFEREMQRQHPFSWLSPELRNLGDNVARFRQVNLHKRRAHHDALELPDGKIVLLTNLCPGQRATVLQLPAQAPARISSAEKTSTAPDLARVQESEFSG